MSEKTKKQISAIKGTKDILPTEIRQWQRVESAAKQIFEMYGYREIRTPVFEATELYIKGTGETSDIVNKEMYTFKDKGGRSITLRPEYTPSVVRAIIEQSLFLKPQPMRYYFIGPMFRYDKPQKGRYRQFHQVDIEVFGEKDAAIDAEIIEMADTLLKRLNVSGYEILVNSVGCRKCRPGYLNALRKSAGKSLDRLCADCQRKVKTNPLRVFDCKVEECIKVSEGFPKITDSLCPECDENFTKFCSYLDAYEIAYTVNPRLVRGLDYYTRITFEFVTSELGAQDAILGGGRYDDLSEAYGGPELSATGFAMGMERLLSVVPDEREEERFVFIATIGEKAMTEGMMIARFLRAGGIECLIEYMGKNLKNQMSRANKLGAPWVLIIGEEEVGKEMYQLKNMKTGEQAEYTRQGLFKTLREKL